ncbi:MAG: hypothetical protein ACLFOC_11215 [Campylobacterales bacterium]
MTATMQQVFDKASALSEIEQNQLARIFLEEIESEQKWETLFASSESMLEKMANEAISEYKNRETKPLDTHSL